MYQTTHVEGQTLVIRNPNGEERHRFDTRPEADMRAAWINELVEWNGTPFVDCAAVKGRKGCADCAKMLWKAATTVGMIENVPEPMYSPRIVYGREESFINFLLSLGAREVETPQIGDVAVYFWGRIYGHGAVIINSRQIIHAYAAAGCVTITYNDQALLVELQRVPVKRPVRYFNIWKG